MFPQGLERPSAGVDLGDLNVVPAHRADDGVALLRVAVDDDIRNIFALTGVLEQHGLNVIHAENGKDGIELLERNPDVDIVLMDIMMPELDGYDTIRIIRGLEQFKSPPSSPSPRKP